MELNDERVRTLCEQARGFGGTWSREQAEQVVAQKVAAVRERFTIDGRDFTPEDAVATVEADERAAWDKAAAAAGLALETELAAVVAVLGDRIAAAKVLPPTIEPLISRQERQLEELTALLIDEKFRARVATMTRAQVVEWYQGAPEDTQAGRRVTTFLESSWPTLTFAADDPGVDVEAMQRWRKVRDARQVARVSAELLTWHTQASEASRHLSFTETMRHLRSGRGIARVPKRLQLAVVS